ncbi:MAG TPA: GtrA family protein [Gaiellaceae bacterium]|jgi:putative flippase GtrA
MEQRDAAIAAGLRARATHALRQRHNWEQLAKFCIVGATGYGVNLLVYTALLDGADLHYRLAATGSFLVAVTNNYLWNRLWTFRHRRGHFAHQGLRFLIVSAIVYVGNLAILTALVELGLGKIVSQAIAIVLVTPANFVGNKLWSFRRRH